MPLRSRNASHNQTIFSLTMDEYFCDDCNSMRQINVVDESFDHEFGTQWIFDYCCVECGNILHTSLGKRTREREPE